MKKNLFRFLLITGTILTLASCASRKYGCPASVQVTAEKLEIQKV